jgi:ribosomal protein S18 acetylase RimI-like enzyme
MFGIDDEQALKLLEGLDWDDRLDTEPEVSTACEIDQDQNQDGGQPDQEDLTFEAVVAEINRVKGLSPADLAKEQHAREEQEHKEREHEKEKRKHLDIQERARRREENEAMETSDPDANSSGSGQGNRRLNTVLQLTEIGRWTAESSSQSSSFVDEAALDEMISAERARVAAHARETELKTLAQAQKQAQAQAQAQKTLTLSAPAVSATTQKGQGQEQKQKPQQAALSSVIYRLAVPGDADEISVFAKRTFRDTFFEPCGYSEEDLRAYLEKSYEPHHWLQHMQAEGDCLMVAVSKPNPGAETVDCVAPTAPFSPSRILGYLLVAGPMDLPHDKLSAADKARSGEVVKLYVCPSTFGTGVAAQLMVRGLVWLLAHFSGDVYLSVWSQNYRAQGFYNKYGGQLAATYKYQVGDTMDDEWVFVLPRTRIEEYFAACASGTPSATTTGTTTATTGGGVFGFRNLPLQPRTSPTV